MGSNPIGALYKHCFLSYFFHPVHWETWIEKKTDVIWYIFLKGRLFICHIFITQNKCRGNLAQRETNLAQGTGRRETLVSGVEWNHASWIILTKHVRIMNLCFKNLGIMNLCSSARESWIMRLWEKLNKIHVKVVAFDPGNAGYGVSESPIFQKFYIKFSYIFPRNIWWKTIPVSSEEN